MKKVNTLSPRFFFKALISIPLLSPLIALGCASQNYQWTPPVTAPPESVELTVTKPGPSSNESMSVEESAAIKTTSLPAEPVAALVLSLDDALHMTMTQNLEMEIQRIGPASAAEAIEEAKARFDPALSISASRSGQNSVREVTSTGTSAGGQSALAAFVREAHILATYLEPPQNLIVQNDSFNTSARISQSLPTGTEWYVTGGYNWQDGSLSDKTRSGSWTVGITQPLLRGNGTDVNLVSIRQAHNNQANADWSFRGYALSLAAETESAYWELALAQENLRIRQFSLQLVEEQLNRNDALITAGSLAESARVSAEAEVASQRAQLVNAEASLHARAINLWRLLNPENLRPKDFENTSIVLPEIEVPKVNAQTSLELAELFRPGLVQAGIDISNGELAVLDSRNGLLPNLDVYLSYGASSSGNSAGAWNDYLDDRGGRNFEAGINFSINLGRRAEKARYRRAKLERDQAEAALFSLRQRVEAELHNSINDLNSQYAQLVASRQEVLSREEEYAVETERFRLGKTTNLNVLQVQQSLIQAKVQAVTAHVRYLQGLTSLFEAEGTLLTRRGIAIEMEKEIGA